VIEGKICGYIIMGPATGLLFIAKSSLEAAADTGAADRCSTQRAGLSPPRRVMTGHKKDCAVSCLGRCGRFQCLHNANASGISGTPAVGSAFLAHASSGLADTVNHHHAHATAHAGLRDHVVWLSKRRWRHCLRRCRDGQRKASSSYQSNHFFPPFVGVSLPSNSVSFGKRKLPWRSQPPAPLIQIKETFHCL
jgi:hypothetical protein